MILNPDWLKPKEKPYFHQISLDCLEKLVECIKRINKGEIDADTSCQIEKQILTDEVDEPEFLNFAVENISELFGYSACNKLTSGQSIKIPCRKACNSGELAWPEGFKSLGFYLFHVLCKQPKISELSSIV